MLCTLFLQLWNVVFTVETLKNVIASVTRNFHVCLLLLHNKREVMLTLQSLVLTAVLALIIVYHYAIIGYLQFQHHFVVDMEGDNSNSGYG